MGCAPPLVQGGDDADVDADVDGASADALAVSGSTCPWQEDALVVERHAVTVISLKIGTSRTVHRLWWLRLRHQSRPGYAATILLRYQRQL